MDATKVFVAGATGRTGSRIVRELLKSDFMVRAGVQESSLKKAEGIFGNTGFINPDSRKRLDIKTVDFANQGSVTSALEGCKVVVCALGASESDPWNWQAPYQVDGRFTQNLIKAASKKPDAVSHFVLVTSLGTGKFGLPASLLNLFWGVLTWKKQSEDALINSGLCFTIVRPGGMERPTDEYELTHNLKLLPADSLSGGQVSRLQVAKLIAAAIQNPPISSNKILEVVAETEAPKLDFETLLRSVSSTVTDAEWKARLSPQQYYVLREAGTERPWTSPLNDEKSAGTYCCAGCGSPLFSSTAKFNSGTGWPSFYQPVSTEAIVEKTDVTLGMVRVETVCKKCGGHLGHVFEDGPRPTGRRYCMNGVALNFVDESGSFIVEKEK